MFRARSATSLSSVYPEDVWSNRIRSGSADQGPGRCERIAAEARGPRSPGASAYIPAPGMAELSVTLARPIKPRVGPNEDRTAPTNATAAAAPKRCIRYTRTTESGARDKLLAGEVRPSGNTVWARTGVASP